MGKLDGKTAVIIGGTTGMALETAKLFVEEGASVVITGRRQDVLDEAVAAIGANAIGVQGDITSFADLDRLYETVRAKSGHIDILFVSGGVGQMNEPVTTMPPESFHRIFQTNVGGVIFAVQKALPLFRDGGAIILNASIAHVKGMAGSSAYSASKAAVRSFARSWAMELKDRNIRVNVLSPGPIATPFTDPAPQEWKDAMTAAVPLNRFGSPREIATAALFLASSDSSYINGVDLFVDGGLTQV